MTMKNGAMPEMSGLVICTCTTETAVVPPSPICSRENSLTRPQKQSARK